MRNAFVWLLRVYAYLFEFCLGMFLLAMGFMAITSGGDNLKLGMLPWEGPTLTRAVFLLGAGGVLFVLLAVFGILRWILPFWALLIFLMMFRGFFLSPYAFPSDSGFHFALWLTGGAFLAFLGSLSLFGRKQPK